MSGCLTRSLAILSAALLFGCASMNEQECATADWRVVGYEDGSRGLPSSRIGTHRMDCAEHGVSPDLTAYTKGHDEGIRVYCIPETGYALGKAGQTMPTLCPGDIAGAFKLAYDEGREAHLDMQRLQSRIDLIGSKIEQIDQQIKLVEGSKVGADGQTASKKEISAANNLIAKLKADKAKFEQTRNNKQRRLAELETSAGYSRPTTRQAKATTVSAE